MNGKSKTNYRQTKAWKELRLSKIESVRGKDGKIRCELTGVILTVKTAQVHHLHPDDYTGQNLEDFRVLSPMAHSFVEWLARIKKDTFPNRESMEAWLGGFLPVMERKTDKYYKELLDNRDSM